MAPTLLRILAAVRAPMPCSWVSEVPEASTASSMSWALIDPAVELAQLCDQVYCQHAQRLAGRVVGSHAAQQGSGAVRTQVTAGATSNEVGEHDVESVDRMGSGLHQIVAVFDEGT